jgi:hypothetical protein
MLFNPQSPPTVSYLLIRILFKFRPMSRQLQFHFYSCAPAVQCNDHAGCLVCHVVFPALSRAVTRPRKPRGGVGQQPLLLIDAAQRQFSAKNNCLPSEQSALCAWVYAFACLTVVLIFSLSSFHPSIRRNKPAPRSRSFQFPAVSVL